MKVARDREHGEVVHRIVYRDALSRSAVLPVTPSFSTSASFAGLTNFFFETPWGQVIEVLTFNGPDTSVRLWGSGPSFADR